MSRVTITTLCTFQHTANQDLYLDVKPYSMRTLLSCLTQKIRPFLKKYEHWRRIEMPGSAWKWIAHTVGIPHKWLK